MRKKDLVDMVRRTMAKNEKTVKKIADEKIGRRDEFKLDFCPNEFCYQRSVIDLTCKVFFKASVCPIYEKYSIACNRLKLRKHKREGAI